MQSNHRGQRIALELHGLQVNCGNCTPQGGIMTSNPSNLLQSFHTDCISIPPPVTQHRPTTRESYHNPVDCGSIRGLLVDCKYNAILTRSRRIATKCSKLVQGWPKSQPDRSPPKISAQNPGNAGTVFCNPGDCGGLGSLAPCEPGTTPGIEDRMQMQGNCFRIAKPKHRGSNLKNPIELR